MRHYDVQVQVRTAPLIVGRDAGAEPPPPSQFLWRDRLYVVREVLAQWRERTAWWAGAAGRGLHGDEVGETSGVDGEHRGRTDTTVQRGHRLADGSGGSGGSGGSWSGGSGALETRWDAADRWVWRVEARAGRSGTSGTYDICREAAGADGEATWRLVRVSD